VQDLDKKTYVIYETVHGDRQWAVEYDKDGWKGNVNEFKWNRPVPVGKDIYWMVVPVVAIPAIPVVAAAAPGAWSLWSGAHTVPELIPYFGVLGGASAVGLNNGSPTTVPENIKPTVEEISIPEEVTPVQEEWGGPLDYSGVPEPRKVGPYLETTRAQRARLLEYNKKMNGGTIRSDIDGAPADQPTLMRKGQKANMNQAEVEHIKERSTWGSNSNRNQRVTTKQQNHDKEMNRRKNKKE